MAKQKTELQVIDFEKFSIAQLPELQGKKEEIASIIKANPIVEIVDNSTYELAKKSRTAVKTLRTGLEKEQKDVKKKIKEFVLDVVDGEYSNLVTDVKSAEKERQDPIDTWETKKEQERLEKALLEIKRVEGIKAKINAYKTKWEDLISQLFFFEIDNLKTKLFEENEAFDRNSLEEFEILFDDVLISLGSSLYSKIDLLTKEEELRLERERFAEIQEEQKRVDVIKAKIDNFDKQWNQRINLLEYSKIKEVSKFFEEETALDCQEFQPVYADIRKQIQEALFLKVSKLSTQEKERVERENFLKEKADFEAKQLEAKFQERKKFLVDEDYWRIYLLAECGDVEEVAKTKLSNFYDSDFEDFKLAVLKSKELVSITKKEPIKVDEELPNYIMESEPLVSKSTTVIGNRLIQGDFQEQTENYHEVVIIFKDGVSEVSEEVAEVMNTFNKVDEEIINEVDSEETWADILEKFSNSEYCRFINDAEEFCNWLSENYNVPIKK